MKIWLRISPFGYIVAASSHLNFGASCMQYLAFYLQNEPDPAAVAHMAMAMLLIIPIIILVCLLIVLIPF
jgi:hypothetical protein